MRKHSWLDTGNKVLCVDRLAHARLPQGAHAGKGIADRQRSDGEYILYVVIEIDGQWSHEHRLVAEKIRGRPLPSSEAVHHINPNRFDNRPKNFEVLSRPEHQWRHHRKQFSFKLGAWGDGREQCVSCKPTAIPHKGKHLCVKCYPRTCSLRRNSDAKD